MKAIPRQFTIWLFRNVAGTQEVTVAKTTEPFETEHEYQRILAHITAYNPKGALAGYAEFLAQVNA